ncbi:MAG: type I-E CRISPR-associated protein Cas6/Cse3/CasE [Anaerolineae bacterium]
MYLSRLRLNPRHRRVQSELARPYELHRSVLRAFPEELPVDERVLYRVDLDPRSSTPWLIVQSQCAPDWRWALDQQSYLLAGAAPEVKRVELALTAGQLLAFRLRANPTKKYTNPQNGEKRRVGLYREEEQLVWLSEKGKADGFSLLRAQVRDEGLLRGNIPESAGKPGHTLTHLAVRFDGLLQVTAPDLLLEAVRNGIGSAKGFGFGLLSLARP